MIIPETYKFNYAENHKFIPDPEMREQGLRELSISCMMSRRVYGYEYIGNTNRLVITPLTDKCFRTIFLSLHYGYGTMLTGPVGTGKTETTKELAKGLGKMCFTFACSNTLTSDAMLKFFKGFISGGSWASFDEFNRLDVSVLAVLTQTIYTMNQALRE